MNFDGYVALVGNCISPSFFVVFLIRLIFSFVQ